MFYTPHSYAFCKTDESRGKIKLYKLAEKILGKRKCVTIACSKGEYEESKQVTKNSCYINNAIDTEELSQAILHEPEKEMDVQNLKICTVGRIGPQKNPKLFNQIAERFPEIPFTWIGDGTLKNVLQAPNIHITGWKKREETIKLLYQNDIFILPSLWEGLPMTLLEAMYLKKVCVVSNVTGNKDVIKSEENGFICQTENEFCGIIEKIKNAEIDCLKIKENAKDEIITNHNMDRMEKEYEKVYCGEDDCY